MTAPEARSAAPDKRDAELVARFAGALARLWPEGGKLGLAVSGGPDSLALLLLAEAAIPGRFEVATVDHGLRPEAAGECAMVAQVCAARAIPCETLRVEPGGGNVQAAAREARYEALMRWADRQKLSAIATAHHADDQVETLLMRLNRGSGVAGLAGVRERTALSIGELPLIRPLLAFRRAELVGLVHGAGFAPAQDPSNVDNRFDRARIRKALAAADWIDRAGVAAAAANLADADDALDWAARREWDEHVTLEDNELSYRPHAPRAVALRVVARAIATLGAEPRGQDVARLLDRLERGEGGNLGGVLARPSHGADSARLVESLGAGPIRPEGVVWMFVPEPARRTR